MPREKYFDASGKDVTAEVLIWKEHYEECCGKELSEKPCEETTVEDKEDETNEDTLEDPKIESPLEKTDKSKERKKW